MTSESAGRPQPDRPQIGRSTNSAMRWGRDAIRGYGMLTARWRPDPEFLVIGAKRGGSTSFYYDMLRHPQMTPLYPRPNLLPKAEATKGIHFFDQNYFRGPRWYRGHLPSSSVRARHARRAGAPAVTGEASPYYLFHPAAAERAAGLLPDVRVIAVLRDPVQRAFSHWKERRRNDREDLDFADALAAEDDRLGEVEQRLQRDPAAYSYAHEQQSYARQSEYDTALERWYARYPSEQILVLASEDYYADPNPALAQAFELLGLPAIGGAGGEARNAAEGSELDHAVRDRLAARFAPHNERLERLTGRSFDWL